jgi:putative ABC transport system substrate-binding protein
VKFALLRTPVAAALALGMLAAAPAFAADKSVAVTAIVEHPALDAVRDGVKAELKAAGYEEGKNLKFTYQSAQGNVGTAAQIARKYVGDQPDVIVAIATPSAQATLAATKTIPVVYSAVTDPVAAKLVKSWDASGTNVTGVSDLSPLDKHIALIKQVVPTAKRIGVIYSPGEANSVAIVADLKKAAAAAGMTVVEAAAARTVDVPTAAQSLVGKADAIYTPTDNNVTSAFEASPRWRSRPAAAGGGRHRHVERGAVAGIGTNYTTSAARPARSWCASSRARSPARSPRRPARTLELHIVNPGAAKLQGVTLSDELLKTAKVVNTK